MDLVDHLAQMCKPPCSTRTADATRTRGRALMSCSSLLTPHARVTKKHTYQPPQCIGELAMGPGSAMRTRAPAAGAVLCERRAHLPVAVPAGRVDATPAGTPPLLPFTCAGLIKKIVTHRRKACDHTKPTVPH